LFRISPSAPAFIELSRVRELIGRLIETGSEKLHIVIHDHDLIYAET
jgi:hypothetical protein